MCVRACVCAFVYGRILFAVHGVRERGECGDGENEYFREGRRRSRRIATSIATSAFKDGRRRSCGFTVQWFIFVKWWWWWWSTSCHRSICWWVNISRVDVVSCVRKSWRVILTNKHLFYPHGLSFLWAWARGTTVTLLGRLRFLARYGVGCVVCIMEYLFHMMSTLCYVIYTSSERNM